MSEGIKWESNTYGKKKHRKMMYSRGQREVFECRHRDDDGKGVGADRIGRVGS